MSERHHEYTRPQGAPYAARRSSLGDWLYGPSESWAIGDGCYRTPRRVPSDHDQRDEQQEQQENCE